jgi:hypothetical protein
VVGRIVDPILRSADVEDISGWFDEAIQGLRRTALRGYEVTADAGARYVTDHSVAEGTTLELVRPRPNVDRIDEALRITGPVAFKTKMRASGNPSAALRIMRTTSAGTIKRLVLAGARETTLATFDSNASVVGYRRVTAPNPCSFCAMLAGRGPVFRSGSSALTVTGGPSGQPRGTRRVGQSYHDSCRCTIEPIYG